VRSLELLIRQCPSAPPSYPHTPIATLHSEILPWHTANVQCAERMNLHERFILWREGPMTITIWELVNIPDFRTRVLAGASEFDRQINWAHVCELPDPTEWLAEDELLMTVGFPIPREPSAQVAFVERIAEAGLSGSLICDQAYAPELSTEMLAVADRHSFPILLTAYEVPFTAIARTVAEINGRAEHTRLLQIIRVYETVRMAV
jgi:PucR family transcriptional regulator, purine catabolism regulatory protein